MTRLGVPVKPLRSGHFRAFYQSAAGDQSHAEFSFEFHADAISVKKEVFKKSRFLNSVSAKRRPNTIYRRVED